MTNEKSQINTWPKKIYLFPRNGNKVVMKEIPTYTRHYLNSQWLDNPIRFSDFASVEYVRSDLIKELLEAAEIDAQVISNIYEMAGIR